MVDETTHQDHGQRALSNAAKSPWRPFEDLRREVDHLIEDFGRSGGLTPLRSPSQDQTTRSPVRTTPAMDIAEQVKAYEIIAELPGVDVKNLEVTSKRQLKRHTDHRAAKYRRGADGRAESGNQGGLMIRNREAGTTV